MKTRALLVIALLCLGVYLFMSMKPQGGAPQVRPAARLGAGTEEERYLKFMRGVLPDGEFPSYAEFKEAAKAAVEAEEEAVIQEEPAELMYDPNISRPSQQEVEENIRLRRERKEAYEEMMAERDQALLRRRMSEFEDSDIQSAVLPPEEPETKDPLPE